MRWILALLMIAGVYFTLGCDLNAKKNVDDKGDPIIERETYVPPPSELPAARPGG